MCMDIATVFWEGVALEHRSRIWPERLLAPSPWPGRRPGGGLARGEGTMLAYLKKCSTEVLELWICSLAQGMPS